MAWLLLSYPLVDPVHRIGSSRRVVFSVALLLCALGGLACLGDLPFRGDADRGAGATPIEQLFDANRRIESLDLFHGVGGRENAPRADRPFRFRQVDTSGFSRNIEVTDDQGRKWDAKLGVEAEAEVVASRLLWAAGYHQPPVYFVPSWQLADGPDPGLQEKARFRLEQPDWKKGEEWAWQDNPFVGTHEMQGLVVLMAMINNWDIKTSNNKIYERPKASPSRLYVVKDLGRSFGHSVRILLGSQSDANDFAREGFIRDVDGDKVELEFDEIIFSWGIDKNLTVDDVLWISRRLERLSERQWRDAFRAGGYREDDIDTYIASMQKKVAQGLALADRARS